MCSPRQVCSRQNLRSRWLTSVLSFCLTSNDQPVRGGCLFLDDARQQRRLQRVVPVVVAVKIPRSKGSTSIAVVFVFDFVLETEPLAVICLPVQPYGVNQPGATTKFTVTDLSGSKV
jgi:hypothetical protein